MANEPPPRPSSFSLPPRPGVFPGGAPFAGGGLGGLGGLKARPKLLKFVEKKLDDESIKAEWSCNGLTRMRTLDSCRKPTPLESESDLLHISDKRLDLHVLKDALCLCGGNAGGRFSDSEFAAILNCTKMLPDIWEKADSVFESLDKAQRKIILSKSYMLKDIDEEKFLNEYKTIEVSSSSLSLSSKEEVEEEETSQAKTIQFHQLSDAYMRCVGKLQSIIKIKQDELIEFKKTKSEGDADADADDESKGRPLPVWLQIFTDKYELEAMPIVQYNLEHNTTPPVPQNAIKLKSYTVGKMACYISGMMTNDVTNTEDEDVALFTLLQASNDANLVVGNDIDLSNIKTMVVYDSDNGNDNDNGIANTDNNIKSETPETPNSGVVYNRRYWANRFYLFLSKMTEMKSRPKDEKGLYLFELHIPPVDEPLPEPSESDLELKAAREETAKDPWVNSDCLAK